MENCATCDAELDPRWKFCITCGTPMPADATPHSDEESTAAPALAPENRAQAKAAASEREAERARVTAEAKAEVRTRTTPNAAAHNEPESIPAAFRSLDAPPKRRKVDTALIVSIGLGGAGAILIIYLALLVFGTRA